MWYEITVVDWQGLANVVSVNADPNSCPICHHAIQPVSQKLNLIVEKEGSHPTIERVFRCPQQDCRRVFVARYAQNPSSNRHFNLTSCVPTEPSDAEFPLELWTISPDFCAIFNEAQKAEQMQLLLVCGPGYRKALEFLVKDYVSRLRPKTEDKEKIERIPLMACIKEYVADARIKTTAERAAWLGNDETHYVRKWADKDLQDLEKFIKLTCHWIESEELTKDAVAAMPEGKK
jgi:hypothetical protein